MALIPTSFFHVGGLVAVVFIMLHTVCYVLMIVCCYRAAKEEVEKKMQEDNTNTNTVDRRYGFSL